MVGTLRVIVRVGDDIRPAIVWAGTRTHLEDRLVGGFERYAREQHWIDEARTRWKIAVHVPIGSVVTTTKARFPIDGEIYLATPDGLSPLSYADAMDALDPDPLRIANRDAQREHDRLADAAGLPMQLTRFVGRHDLQNGVHRVGNSAYFAERCTARQAYWRRATRAEVAALA
ncbi:hypothetical protein [Methylobacterium sp. SI9]|uniref:hypothetical protein n=1 Tax=Methylobacterium guangdongense TaxID=3138811 RepID=UPI00313B2544